MDWITLLQSNLTFMIILSGVFGLLMGSFLNVVIYRLPKMLHVGWVKECTFFLKEHYVHETVVSVPEPSAPTLNLAWPASHCPTCKHVLGALENIPVLSFCFQKGRCKHCKGKIDLQYPLVEIITALMTGLTVWHFGLTWVTWMALLFTWSLIALSFIDFNHHLLPDDMTLPFLWFGLFLNLFYVFTTPQDAVIGAIAGYLSLWIVYQLFKLITKKEGMGHGDFKLLAMLGAWLGWQNLPLIIILSSFIGATVGITLILFYGHDKAKPIPFGPYIALAGWISLLWGDMITSRYLSLLGIQITL